MNELDDNKNSRPPSRGEVDTIQRRITGHELSIKQVREALDQMKITVNAGISVAKADAAAALSLVEKKVDQALYILERQEDREQAKAEVEAEFIAARAREEAKIQEQVRERISMVEATGRFHLNSVLTVEKQKDGITKRRSTWITIAISAMGLISGGIGWLISHFSNK